MKAAEQINWGVICALLVLLVYCLTFGVQNVKHLALVEALGTGGAERLEVKRKMAEKLPELFTVDFYQSDEEFQIERAEKFWKEKIAPLAKVLPPDEIADSKAQLLKSIKKLNS